jgi:hypothetical protein
VNEKNYYGPNSSSFQEPKPPFTLIQVVGLTEDEVLSVSEQFRSMAVYHADDNDTVLIAGHHEQNSEKFPFLNTLKERVTSWKKVNGWPKGFAHLVIPPSQRVLNLAPCQRV